MKKILSYFLGVVFLLSLFSGCSNTETNSNSTNLKDVDSQVLSEGSRMGHMESLLSAIKKNEVENLSGWDMRIENEYSELIILEYGEEIFENNESTTYAFIMSATDLDRGMFEINSMTADYFLSIEKNGVYRQCYLGNFTKNGDKFDLVDIDGDGLNEIVMKFYIQGTIHPNASNLVLKVVDTSFEIVYQSQNKEKENIIDTGFQVSFHDGYTMQIDNIYTGYTETFDARDVFSESYREKNLNFFFDNNGNVNVERYAQIFSKEETHENGNGLGFVVFHVVDIDGDGISEILVSKDFSFAFQGSIELGTEFALLRYNPLTEQFDVIDAAFIPDLIGNKWVENNLDYEVCGVTIAELYN